MAKISTYSTDSSIAGTEKLIGSDVDGTTLNYTISSLASFMAGTGITATDGVLSVSTADSFTIASGSGLDDDSGTLSVDVSDFMTNGANNYILTATGTDAMNAEANLQFDGSTLAVTGKQTIVPGDTGGTALAITGTDIDKPAISITQTGDQGIYIDHNFSTIASNTLDGLLIDLDKTGASTTNNTVYGIRMLTTNTTATAGTNNSYSAYLYNTTSHAADAGTVNQWGIYNVLSGGTNGTTTAIGEEIIVTGQDTQIGLQVTVDTGQTHIKLKKDANDYATLAVADTGDLTIATVGDGAVDSDIILDPDGKLVITPADISGDVFHLDANADTDNIVNIDAGALDVDASAAITIDGASFSLDSTTDSNITVTGSGQDLDIITAGGGTQELRITGNGTGTAIMIDTDTGGITIGESLLDGKTLAIGKNAATEMVFSPHGTPASEKISLINTAGTAADAIAITATAGSLDLNAGDNVTIDAADTMTLTTADTGADGKISIISAVQGSNTAFHLDANADAAASIVDIDAGVLDIDVGGTATVTTGGLTKFEAVGVEIENADGNNTPALLIDNNDNDEVALSINDIGLKPISIVQAYSDTTAVTTAGIHLDFDKTGSSSSNNTMYGLLMDMDNTTATSGTNYMIGAHITPTLTHAADGGVAHIVGVNVEPLGGTNGTGTTTVGFRSTAADADTNYNFYSRGGTVTADLMMVYNETSYNTPSNYASLKVGANGALTVATNDSDGTAGHLNLSPNGNVVVNSPLVMTKPTVTNFTGDDANATIPITEPYANIDANGSARSGARFGGTGTAGQFLVVNNTGGENVTFHNTEGTALLRGVHADHDTMPANFMGLFVSDGTYWNLIAGGVDSQPDVGLTAG